MPNHGNRRGRRSVAAVLVVLFAATGASPAAAKTTAQRLTALEHTLSRLNQALTPIRKQHQDLATGNQNMQIQYNALLGSYNGLRSCLRRTPMFSWPSYLRDTNGGLVPNQTTTALDWYNPAGVFTLTSGLLPDFTNKIHALSLANTPGCLAYATFRDPTLPSATGLAGAAPVGAKP